jgi:hypothetical protein
VSSPRPTVLQLCDVFPAGTVVGAYPAAAALPGTQRVTGSVVETATVQADGTLTFTTLERRTPYLAHGIVAGQDRAIRFLSRDREHGRWRHHGDGGLMWRAQESYRR